MGFLTLRSKHTGLQTKLRNSVALFASAALSDFGVAQEPVFSSVLLVPVVPALPTAGALQGVSPVTPAQTAPGSPGTGASFAEMFSSLNIFVELMGIRHLTYLDAAINAAGDV